MVKKIINIILFLVFMILIAEGNTMSGYLGIGIMFLGLSGLLTQLFFYNKQYQ